MVHPRARAAPNTFQMRLGIGFPNHVLESHGVFAEIVPQPRQPRRRTSAPGVGETLRPLGRIAQMLKQVVHHPVILPTVGDGRLPAVSWHRLLVVFVIIYVLFDGPISGSILA
jgi:hypothetical protein